MKLRKVKLALGMATTVAMGGAMYAPQAAADAQADQIRALQAQINQMQSQINSLSRTDPQVMELNEWMISEKTKEVVPETKDNMVFFRGGYARQNELRNGVSIQSDVVPIIEQDQASRDGWYIGAGFDWSVSNNFFGIHDGTEFLAELMFSYSEFANDVKGNALASDPTPLVVPVNNPRSVTVNMARVSAAPKIKFLKGSKFRPWIIPVGLSINVISPPSESITVLQPAMMFGIGGDWNFWGNMYLGVDARYNLSLGTLDGVDTDGMEAGGYLGFGF